MTQLRDEPTCPRCGAAMVRRVRGTDNTAFWGCSDFPTCRGTRELVASTLGVSRPAAARAVPIRRDAGHGRHFDRFVLACGAVGLLIGLGFVGVGLNSGPSTYAFLGAFLLALMALVVLTSPFLPREFARSSALKIAFFCVFVAVFLIALGPFSDWFSQYWTGVLMHSIPTPSAAPPSLAR